MKSFPFLVAAAVLTCTSACFPPANQATNSAYSGQNRYGYRGSQTDPSGQLGTPSAGPDGAIAQAMAPQPNAGTLALQNGSTIPPAGANGNSLSGPILPGAGNTATRPADTGLNPTVPSAPPSAPTLNPDKPKPPQIGTSSKPLDAPVQNKPKDDYPYGIPVPGKDGMVYSPFDKEAGYVDVRNMKPGALVEDPYTKKLFRVP
ncbi:MAG: hypothetical protein ACKO2G_09810 [Verrucomicrobiales bacterium]